jgi:hypothetical protein
MCIPKYVRLIDATRRARLLDLRSYANDILAGNYLPSFPDHSVAHSDRLCNIIDQISNPAEKAQLSDREAFVLYAACYLHDIGLQNHRAGEMQVIAELLNNPDFIGRKWEDLEIPLQKRIVREQHHRISREMVLQSIATHNPILGIQLNQDWDPGQIAGLCLAHCLDTDSIEYQQITKDWGPFRMSLLSALLRLADILDESRGRSRLYLEPTRSLDLEAKLHWWRHHYVADVQIDQQARQITLWFDFPPDRRPQYRELFMPMQVPLLEAEFSKHSAVLAPNNMLWAFRVAEVETAQSTAKAMDNEMERYVLERTAQQRELKAEQDQLLLLKQLKEVRPTLDRELRQLRDSSEISPEAKILKFREIAKHLWRLGGHRDAWMTLLSEYERTKSSIDLSARLETALELADMMLKDRNSHRTAMLLRDLYEHVISLCDNNPLKLQFLIRMGRAYMEEFACNEANDVLSKALSLTSTRDDIAGIEALLAEAQLLRGELSVFSNAVKEPK